jgi:hypothetical protein
VAAVVTTAGCAGVMDTPTAQSVGGLSPAGNVTITESFVTGVGGGSGTLEYQGWSYSFKVVGTVARRLAWGPARVARRLITVAWT